MQCMQSFVVQEKQLDVIMLSSMNALLYVVGEHSRLNKLHVHDPCICLTCV